MKNLNGWRTPRSRLGSASPPTPVQCSDTPVLRRHSTVHHPDDPVPSTALSSASSNSCSRATRWQPSASRMNWTRSVAGRGRKTGPWQDYRTSTRTWATAVLNWRPPFISPPQTLTSCSTQNWSVTMLSCHLLLLGRITCICGHWLNYFPRGAGSLIC